MRKVVAVCLILSSGICSAERKGFDNGWKFVQEDVPGAHQENFSDDQWRALDLPHDWSVEGKFERNNPSTDRSGYLPTGVGWYRKTVTVPQSWRGKHVAIEFDGVFRNSTVWANGQMLGKRPYGWISFGYDISELAKDSDRITFAVQVDNKLQHAARWYTGSGIYGHTWINVRDPIHIPMSGVWVRTQGSTVTVDTDVVNTTDADADCLLKTTILDAKGVVVATKQVPLALARCWSMRNR
jgi:beta-galactosidase